MKRILVIDDDQELCDLLIEYLRSADFDVEAVHDAKDGIQRAVDGRYDMAILDVMLPEMDGFEVLRRVRASSNVPVLMLTARGEDVDRIVGLEIGADDYIAKPFNPRELVARLRAILRRSRNRESGPVPSRLIRVGDVEFDPGARAVRCAGRSVVLTATELALLEALLRAAGNIVSRDELSNGVLGRRSTPYDRSIDVHVSKLRKKLGPRAGGTERIESVRGTGYVYLLPPSDD